MTSVQAHPHVLPPAQTPAYSETAVTRARRDPATPARAATAVALESPMVGVFYRSPSPETRRSSASATSSASARPSG